MQAAVDIVQLAAVVIASGMSLQDFLRIPVSFPIYAGVLTLAVAAAAREFSPTSQSDNTARGS